MQVGAKVDRPAAEAPAEGEAAVAGGDGWE